MLEGVSKVQVYGAKRAVRIQFSPEQLAAYQIGVDELAVALKAGTVNIPGGSLNGPMHTFTIEPQGQLRTAREYGELIVAYRNNAPVRLKDVAHCVDSVANDLVDIRYGKSGQPEHDKCVVMPISRVSGANTVEVADRIMKTLEIAKHELPGSITIETMFNGAAPIRESLHDVQVTVGIALVLVVLVIFFFLGRIRETVIPSIVLPVTLLGTMIAMLPAKFNIDTLSLMGIVLAVTFLVDDAIVVLENTVRHLEEGMKPIPAAVRSMKEITFTLISTSVALIIVFTPLVFMSGAVGRNLSEFALTVIFAIVISTLVALTLSPMMCARIIKHHKEPNAVQRWITNNINALIRQYGKALRWQLRHKWTAAVAWLLCILGSAVLYFVLPGTFLPPGDSSFIMGAMIMPQGASTEQMRAYQTKVSAIIRSDTNNVVQVGNVTGIQPGADQSMGFIFIRLKPPRERPPIDQLVQQFMGRLMAIPDGFCSLHAMPVLKISSGAESTAIGSDYAYQIMGLDRDTVYKTALRTGAGNPRHRRDRALRRAEQREAQHAAAQRDDRSRSRIRARHYRGLHRIGPRPRLRRRLRDAVHNRSGSVPGYSRGGGGTSTPSRKPCDALPAFGRPWARSCLCNPLPSGRKTPVRRTCPTPSSTRPRPFPSASPPACRSALPSRRSKTRRPRFFRPASPENSPATRSNSSDPSRAWAFCCSWRFF